MKSTVSTLALVLGFLLCAQKVVYAASFNCAQASTKVEQLICTSSEVSALDGELAELYREVQAGSPDDADKEPVLNAQGAWLREVRDLCADELCLTAAYKSRTQALRTSAVASVQPADPEPPAEDLESLPRQPADPGPSVATTIAAVAAPSGQLAQGPKQAAITQPSKVSFAEALPGLVILAMLVMLALWLGRRVWIYFRNLVTQEVVATPLRSSISVTEASPTKVVTRSAAIVWLSSIKPHARFAIVLVPVLLFVHWGLSIVYLLVYLAWGGATLCPDCKQWFARVNGSSKVIAVESGYETVTRHDEVRARTGNFYEDTQGGKRVGTIVRQEQVHVTYTTRRHYYSCKYCDHSWTEKKTTSS